MRVLVACEFSGIVRDAFISRGHDTMSCDLLPTEKPGPHYQGDVLDILDNGWDLMVAHPPCTHLAVSGARWFKDKVVEQVMALEFVRELLNAPVDRICLENPVSIISTRIRKPDQIIQPWQFGDSYQKTTCLWLKNLPLLIPSEYEAPLFDMHVDKGHFMTTKSGKRFPKWYNVPPGPERQRIRSRTFKGIAEAMAEQWG